MIFHLFIYVFILVGAAVQDKLFVGLLKETNKQKRRMDADVNFLQKFIKSNFFLRSFMNICTAVFFTRYLCVLFFSVLYVSILALPFLHLLVLMFFCPVF